MAVGELGKGSWGDEKGCGEKEDDGSEGCDDGSNGKGCREMNMQGHSQRFLPP